MANIIIKTDQQRDAEAFLMKSYGIDPQSATAEQREYAREISRQTEELKKEMEANRL